MKTVGLLHAPAPVTDVTSGIMAAGLTKSFGHFLALRGINLDLPEGCFLTILGPNGAGKSTLIRVLATLARPTSGKVFLAGLDTSKEGIAARRLLGVVLHQTLLYDDLTAEQNLRFYGRLYGVPDLTHRILEVAEEVGIENHLRAPVRTFSRGMQQRLAIARATLHRPAIMLLDEPDTGLDLEAAASLKQILRGGPGAQRTVVMTTHNLERGLQFSDRVAIMHRGRIVYMEQGKVDPAIFREVYIERTGLRE